MRKITIEHLARVEGHGAIKIEIERKNVKKVRIEILEGPRLFETLALGKLPEENLSIVPRICAICSLSHKFASLRGLEKCLDIKVPEKTRLLRELMLMGEMIESHSLHVCLLALPDLLGYPSAIAMVEKHGDTVVRGLMLKKFGNKIMEVVSGRVTHGENPIIGGFGRYPSNDEMFALKDDAKNLADDASTIIDLVGSMKVPNYFDKRTNFICLKPSHNEYGFVGESLIISDGQEFDLEDYKKVINEKVVSHSYAKRSMFNNAPYTVGAIARMNNLGDKLTGKSAAYHDQYRNVRWERNPLFNNLAQSIEILYVLERIPILVDKIVNLKDPPVVKPKRDTGNGTGAVEAPRGTLIHSYEVTKGKMSGIDIVTPTAQNLEDIERYLRISTEYLLQKEEKDENIRKQLEIIARSYDPCISCSAHLVKLVRK